MSQEHKETQIHVLSLDPSSTFFREEPILPCLEIGPYAQPQRVLIGVGASNEPRDASAGKVRCGAVDTGSTLLEMRAQNEKRSSI